MNQDIPKQFHEAMKSKTMYRKLLRRYCEVANNVTSDTLKDLANLAITHIIQVVESGNKDKKDSIKDATLQLKGKLLQRWERWNSSQQKDTLRVLLKQAWALANARSSFEEVEKQLRQRYSLLCNLASQDKVGMESHVQNVMKLLTSNHIVAVCGMVGIGKTTLLKELDETIRNQNKHIVAHLEVRQQNVEDLQQSLLFQLNRKPLVPIVRPQNSEAGRRQLTQCLHTLRERGRRTICLIIDGVVTKDFLKILLPSNIQEFLSPPSCLIASTRDKAVARDLFELCCQDISIESSLYMLLPLQPPDAEALFRANAEEEGFLLQESEQDSILKDVVPLCGGLPLALVKCGSYFASKENRKNKGEVTKQLREASKEVPFGEIFAILEEHIDKDYVKPFVDVAPFWKGKDWTKSTLALIDDDNRGILNYLQEKCVVFCDDNRVKVHTLLEALAKRFSHENNTRYLKDAQALTQEKDRVRGLSCSNRTINIDHLSLTKELRYLDLKRCSLHLNLFQAIIPFWASIPIQRHIFLPLLFAFFLPNFILLIYSPITVSLIIISTLILTFFFVNQFYSPPRSLSPHLTFIVIKECGNARKLLKQISKLQHLRYLDLSWNSSLRALSSNFFISLTSLIHLDLSNCENLQQIPSSIGKLTCLQYLDLSTCTSLKELPDAISSLVSLETLLLSNCYGLLTLPNSIGGLKSLRSLKLSNCPTLKRVPLTLFDLISLQTLDISQNTKLEGLWHSIANLISLQYLNMSHYDKLEDLPASIGNLKSLKVLNLSNCRRLKRVPETLGKLNSLEELYLSSCDELEVLPMEFIEKLPCLEKISVPMKYKDEIPLALQNKIIYPQN